MSAPANRNDSPELSPVTDSPPESLPESAPPGRRPEPQYRPVLLIFLGMPILAALVALLLSGSPLVPGPGQATATPPEPPVVIVTPSGIVGVGSAAPEFALEQPGGGTVRLVDYRGGWLVLNFWATWCGPCRAEMPILQDLVDGKIAEAKEVPGGVAVVAVNFNESAEAVQAYFDDMALSLTAALDPQGKISRQFGAYQLPITLFVDPEGVVRFKHIGALSFEALDDYLHHMAEDAGR